MDDNDTIREQLSAYMDGELSEQEAQRVERATEADPALAEELASLRATRRVLHDLPRERAGEDFVRCVLERAERERLTQAGESERAGWWTGRVEKLAGVAAVLVAGALMIGLIVGLWNMQDFDDRMASYDATQEEPSAAPDEALARRRERSVMAKGGDRSSAMDGGTLAPEFRDYLRDADTRTASARAQIDAALDRYLRRVGQMDRDVRAAAAPAEIYNVDIYTNDVTDTRRSVELALIANGITPLTMEDALPENQRQAATQSKAALSRANFFHNTAATRDEVQYVAFVNPEQQRRLGEELGDIRKRQVVAQRPEPRFEMQIARLEYGNGRGEPRTGGPVDAPAPAATRRLKDGPERDVPAGWADEKELFSAEARAAGRKPDERGGRTAKEEGEPTVLANGRQTDVYGEAVAGAATAPGERGTTPGARAKAAGRYAPTMGKHAAGADHEERPVAGETNAAAAEPRLKMAQSAGPTETREPAAAETEAPSTATRQRGPASGQSVAAAPEQGEPGQERERTRTEALGVESGVTSADGEHADAAKTRGVDVDLAGAAGRDAERGEIAAASPAGEPPAPAVAQRPAALAETEPAAHDPALRADASTRPADTTAVQKLAESRPAAERPAVAAQGAPATDEEDAEDNAETASLEEGVVDTVQARLSRTRPDTLPAGQAEQGAQLNAVIITVQYRSLGGDPSGPDAATEAQGDDGK